jgi:hypothetical protein
VLRNEERGKEERKEGESKEKLNCKQYLATSPAESPARPGPAWPGPAPDNALLLSSATAQNVTGKQNRTGSYKLAADGATSVSRLLTWLGFGTMLVVTDKTDA